MVAKAGLRSADIKAGCGKCGACSSLSVYEGAGDASMATAAPPRAAAADAVVTAPAIAASRRSAALSASLAPSYAV
jgi:hypothetical protein